MQHKIVDMHQIEKRLELLNVVFELNYGAGKVLVDYAKNGMFEGLNRILI